MVADQPLEQHGCLELKRRVSVLVADPRERSRERRRCPRQAWKPTYALLVDLQNSRGSGDVVLEARLPPVSFRLLGEPLQRLAVTLDDAADLALNV
jgi:hypothetical protein